MSNCIGWNQLTPAQQQMIPTEYKNKDIPKSVIEQNNIALTASQWSVFSASPVQTDVTTYKVTDYEVQPKKTSFWSKAAEFGKKLVVGTGFGVVAGLFASLLFPVGGAIACGIVAGIGGYMYASKKAKEAKQKAQQQAQQQAIQNQQAQNTQAPEQEVSDTPKTETPAPAETETQEDKTPAKTKSSADLFAEARELKAANGGVITREVQEKYAEAYAAQTAEAIASCDPARIKAAEEKEEKFYRDNPVFAKSVGKYPGDSTTSTSTTPKTSSTTSTTSTTTSTESETPKTSGTSSSSELHAKPITDLTKEERDERIKNPKPGSKLADLYKLKANCEKNCETNNKNLKEVYKNALSTINNQIDDAIKLYYELSAEIAQLEDLATADTAETLKNKKAQRDNLY